MHAPIAIAISHHPRPIGTPDATLILDVPRLRDGNSCCVLRANAAEDNVGLHRATGRRRVPFAGRERLPIAVGAWHILGLRLEGDRSMAWLDEASLFDARDARTAGAGHVVLWSIFDSQTVFEAPSVEVLR